MGGKEIYKDRVMEAYWGVLFRKQPMVIKDGVFGGNHMNMKIGRLKEKSKERLM